MASLTSVPFVGLFACSWIFILCQETQELKVKPGEDATLQCRVYEYQLALHLVWRRIEPGSKKNLIIRQVKRFHEKYHDASFHGRVELRDPKMKDEDASVILKNVTFDDTGTYECEFHLRFCKEQDPYPILIIRLTSVTDPGHTAGHKEEGDKEGGDKEGGDKGGGDKEGNVGLKVSLPVGVILLVGGICGFMIFRNCGRCVAMI